MFGPNYSTYEIWFVSDGVHVKLVASLERRNNIRKTKNGLPSNLTNYSNTHGVV